MWTCYCTPMPIGACECTYIYIFEHKLISLSRNALLHESQAITPQCLQLRLYTLHAWFPHAGLTVTFHLYTHYAGPRTELFFSLA